MGHAGSRREERDQAAKFSLGVGNFADTSHTINSQIGSSLFGFLANWMFPEEMLRYILYWPLTPPEEGWMSWCVGRRISAQWDKENGGILLEASTLWRQRWDALRRETEEGPSRRWEGNSSTGGGAGWC